MSVRSTAEAGFAFFGAALILRTESPLLPALEIGSFMSPNGPERGGEVHVHGDSNQGPQR